MKWISKQLITNHDDLIRKQLEFDNDVKAKEEELKTKKSALDKTMKDNQTKLIFWDNVLKMKEADMKSRGNVLKTKESDMKGKENELKTREARLLSTTNSLVSVLSQLKPNMFKHTEITQLFGKSINNDPTAMAKLKTIVDFKMDVNGAKKMIASRHGHLDPFYDIISTCNKNSKHYGATDSKIQIEVRCEQLSKQIHFQTRHYDDLLKSLFFFFFNKHINPHKPDMTAVDTHPVTGYYWKSDYDSGKIPKFTPQLKLFFKTPNIANNAWIQFHGPGTVLYDIDPGFKLTMGSLCDPNGKGSFTSIDLADKETDPDGQYSGKSFTSLYQISFKWE